MATDIPVNKRHLDMAGLVFGAESMETHAVMQGNINVNAPWIHDETMSGALTFGSPEANLVTMALLQGFGTEPEAFGRDAYLETGPGANFLSTQHRWRHQTSANFQPDIPKAGPCETWVADGNPTAAQRATAQWKKM